MRTRFTTLLTAALLTALSMSAQTVDKVSIEPPMQDAGQDSAKVDLNAPMMDYDNPVRYIIGDVRIHGIKFLDPDIIAATAGLQKGDSVYLPGNYISQAIAKLWSQRYYSDIKVLAEPVGDTVLLDIYFQERPRVIRWLYDGIRKSEATTLTEDLKLKPGFELSDYVLEKNIYLIRKHYEEKGFRNIDITTRVANDSVLQNGVNVTFVIDKKQRVRIGQINFEGNEVFTDKRIRRSMKKIHQRSINIFNNTKLKSEEYETDMENIIDFYNARGYRNANIVSDSIYVLSDNRIGIDIKVDEGNKYYYRNIDWVGNSKYPTDQLSRMLGVKEGDAYDKKTLNERLGIGKESNPQDVSTVSALYQNNGYLASQVDPSEIIIGDDSIDLQIKIFEGNQYTINNVLISGNNKVNDEVIRREIYTRPGELYSREMIMQTISQLAAMGHFDEASVQQPSIQPVAGSTDLVDIAWPLSEKASDKFEISGGWGSGMFVGSVGVVLTNIATQNLFKKDAWRPYPHGQNQQLSIKAQTNGSYYSAFSLGFTEPWLGGKKPNSLSVSAYWSEETTDYYSSYYGLVKNNQFFRAMGVSAGIGRRLRWPDQYFTLYNEIGYQAYNLRDWSYFIFSNGRSNVLTFRTVLSRNSTNSPIYPSQGSDISLSLTLTPPHSLFDGKDYASLSDDDDSATKYKWIEYHKWLMNFKWFYPLTNDNKLVLMCRADFGYLGHYNSSKLSPFEGFDVGGDGMSGYNIYGVDIISMRGYDDGALTPSSSGNSYANVYNKYTVEVRYPVIMQPQSQIYALLFAEGGNAWNDIKDFNPFQIKRSAGAGVRLYLPVVGMLGVDWGWGFDRAYGASKRSGSQFHFVIGQQF